jgi:hypothetical protein
MPAAAASLVAAPPSATPKFARARAPNVLCIV